MAVQAYSQDKPEYCRIVGEGKFLSSKIKVRVDFGEMTSYLLSDEKNMFGNNKKMKFDSMVDALNYMDKQGYEFIDAYAITVDEENVYHYLLRLKD